MTALINSLLHHFITKTLTNRRDVVSDATHEGEKDPPRGKEELRERNQGCRGKRDHTINLRNHSKTIKEAEKVVQKTITRKLLKLSLMKCVPW